MANYGMKVSKKGKNVRTVTDPRSFISKSSINILKIAKQGSGTASLIAPDPMDPDANIWTLNVNHNLGYRPIVFFYFEHPEISKWVQTPSRVDFNVDTASYIISGVAVNQTVNRTQLQLEIDDMAPSYPVSVKYKYYVMIEPRQDAWYD